MQYLGLGQHLESYEVTDTRAIYAMTVVNIVYYVCTSSSRSHLMVILRINGMDSISGAVSSSTLTLCDLAGSERISKTEATGQRLVEAAAINKSLTALGQVLLFYMFVYYKVK